MAKPTINTYYSPKTTIDRGESTNLVWSVFNADTVYISRIGNVSHTGGKNVSPTVTTSYVMNASNDDGSVSKTVKITVIQPEPPEPEPPEPTPPIPEPPTPGECPDFWEDPIGWTLCTLTSGFSVFIEWFGTSFQTFINSIQTWAAGFTIEFWYFLQNPVESIKTWMSGVFVSIGELTNQISTGISDWWKQGIIDVGVMITSATQGFSSWIDDRFTGINDWWADAQTVWGTFWNDRIKGVEDWVNEFSTNVSNWYNSNIQPTIDIIGNRLDDAKNWILDFPTLLSTWWNDRMIDIGVWIVEATTGFNEWINGFAGLIGDWWTDRVVEIGIWLTDRNNEIKLWVEVGLPGWIDDMFDWAKPVIQPIMDAVGFLGQIVGIVTGTAPESESIKAVKENYKEQTDRINDVLGRP